MMRIAAICSTTVRHFTRLLADESGATAIEYAMIAAGVGAAVAATVYSLGSSVKSNLYEKVSDSFP